MWLLPVCRRRCARRPEIMAPEILSLTSAEDSYTRVADFWSLGCTACAWITGSTLFAHISDVATLIDAILTEEVRGLLPLSERLGEVEREFLEALLTRDPASRLGALTHTQILAHTWVTPPCASRPTGAGCQEDEM